MHLFALIPAGAAAVLYAAGSLHIKRSLQAGINRRRAIAVTNIAMMLWSLPLFFVSRGEPELQSMIIAAGAGAALFLGRILSVNALHAGDLSIVGPLLGMKTLLVACFSFATGQTELTPRLWTAAILVTTGVVLLQKGPQQLNFHRRKAAFYAALASILFASCDIMVVEARDQLGIGWLSPTLFVTVGLLTPFLGKPAPAPELARKPLLIGAVIMGFQTSLIIMLIGLTGQAVVINIVYATRALWTVLIDRFFGSGEGIHEFFGYRMIGAICVVVAIVIVIFTQ